jgi:poly(3-hydroxyalkanoate) depolymerase
MSSAEVGYVRVQGLKLRYWRSAGEGEPLLLCNGIGANLELALPLVRALSGIPVVMFDLPGTGGSRSAWLWPSLSRYARLAVGVLAALGHRDGFGVAGVSWGGTLALQIAREQKARVRKLVLMATSPGVTMVPGRLSALLRMTTPRRYISRSFMARNAGTIYGGEMRNDPQGAAEFASLTRAPSGLSYLQQVLAASTFTSLPWLHTIRCPALVINGADDPLVRPINARLLAMLLGDARLHLVRGGGHLFMIMRPALAGGLIRSFLRSSTP